MRESSLFDVLGCFDKYLLLVLYPFLIFVFKSLKLDLSMVQVRKYCLRTGAVRNFHTIANFLRAPAGISALKLTRAKARRVIQNYYLFIYYFKLRPSGFDHGGSILDHQLMSRNETILIQTSTSNTTFALLFWFKVLFLKPKYHFITKLGLLASDL